MAVIIKLSEKNFNYRFCVCQFESLELGARWSTIYTDIFNRLGVKIQMEVNGTFLRTRKKVSLTADTSEIENWQIVYSFQILLLLFHEKRFDLEILNFFF